MAGLTFSSLLKGIELTLSDLTLSQNIYYKSLTWLSEMIDTGPFCSKMQPFTFLSWEKSKGSHL